MAKKKTRKTRSARSKPAAKKATKKPATKKAAKRPGRKRTDWKHTSFAEIEAWRKSNNLPKYRVAEVLGISNGTYHNWARGRAVPSMSTQRKIKSILTGAPPTSQAATTDTPALPAASTAGAPIRSDALRAATEIVNTYLQTHPGKLSPDRFTRLVRDVLMAVS